MNQHKKVHLVLGSGGARGMAHIGVIEMLEDQGYQVVSVAGCSMGAVVGGMYCAGCLPAYKDWLLSLNKKAVWSLFDFTFSKQGFVKGEKVLGKLRELAGEQDIEQFAIPFTAVATDLLHKKEVHFNAGNFYTALRASMGIPGVFTPVAATNSFMVDGSVLNPLPIDLVKKNSDELIVAVNLNGRAITLKKKEPILSEADATADTWTWMKKYLPFTNTKEKVETMPSYSMFNMLNTCYDFTQDRLTEMMIQVHQPDLVVEIPRNACAVFEFYRAAELIETGRDAYNKACWR